MVRDRDLVNKQLVHACGSIQKQEGLVKVHENTRRNLEQEIGGYKAEGHKQRKMLVLLERDGRGQCHAGECDCFPPFRGPLCEDADAFPARAWAGAVLSACRYNNTARVWAKLVASAVKC